MTPDEINCEIAEWMGWQWYRIPDRNSRKYRCLFVPAIHEIEQSPAWLIKADGAESICNTAYLHREGLVPDYYHDLNAIHEALGKLTGNQKAQCGEWLINFLDEEFCELAGTEEHVFACSMFDAPSLCEALLRTIGKWKE